MLKVGITDPKTGKSVPLLQENALPVVVHPHPPLEEDVLPVPFRQFFTDDGTAGGSEDMIGAAGTLADPVEFYISAMDQSEVFIKTIAIVIADANADLNQFGNFSALTNGVEFYWETQRDGKTILHPALKSNFDFVQLALGQPAFGNTSNAFKASNVVGSAEGYIPVVDFQATFGLQWGLRLAKGSTERLVISIRDTIPNVDRFDIVAFGFSLNE